MLIYNYKSIGEKCSIDFDSKSTILVGKSNVGKTNILEAILFAFNNDPLEDDQICSWNKNQQPCIKVFVKVEDTVRSFKEIIEGKHDDLPENAFYMVGSIEDAIEKAKSE